MFPYRVKYKESEYDIQNNDLLHKIQQKHQTTFEILKSKSAAPQKQTRTDVFGHAIETQFRCASFITIYYFWFLLFMLWQLCFHVLSIGIQIWRPLTKVENLKRSVEGHVWLLFMTLGGNEMFESCFCSFF